MQTKLVFKESRSRTETYSIKIDEDEKANLAELKDKQVDFPEMVRNLIHETWNELNG
ncbi:MAG: hypothetical protein KQ78_01498 [Candidatus Izimaplasma bacterium HR2]|nr:MAG: hypothetical protein KQ78_01498 [Candidatus Izimaplasma bacterium HR2]